MPRGGLSAKFNLWGVLDEIDCRVDAALKGDSFIKCMSSNIAGKLYLTYRDDENKVSRSGMCRHKYTRSLDAQEALDVEGWLMNVYSKHCGSYRCVLDKREESFVTPNMKTEPLARLHARIQVMIWGLDNG